MPTRVPPRPTEAERRPKGRKPGKEGRHRKSISQGVKASKIHRLTRPKLHFESAMRQRELVCASWIWHGQILRADHHHSEQHISPRKVAWLPHLATDSSCHCKFKATSYIETWSAQYETLYEILRLQASSSSKEQKVEQKKRFTPEFSQDSGCCCLEESEMSDAAISTVRPSAALDWCRSDSPMFRLPSTHTEIFVCHMTFLLQNLQGAFTLPKFKYEIMALL